MSNSQQYLNFQDIFVIPAINNKSEAKLQYKDTTTFISCIEDPLWEEFAEKYPDKEDSDEDFTNWVNDNAYKVYDIFEAIIENEKQENLEL